MFVASQRRWRWQAISSAVALLVGNAFADPAESPWAVRVWRSDDGLPNNMVLNMAQTPDGYLWLATSTRVARFDGDKFESIPRSIFGLGTAPRTIGALTSSRDGGLWLVVNQGPVIHARGGALKIFAQNPGENVQTATEDEEGALWITYRGNVIYRLKNGVMSHIGPESELPGRTIASFALDRAGQFWCAKGGIVGIVRDAHFHALATLPKPNATLRITPAAAGGVWLATNTHLYRFVPGKETIEYGPFQPDQLGDESRVILEDSRGGVWIGTAANGLFHFDGSRFEAIGTSHREILSLFESRDGNIWVGTGGGGLDQVRPRMASLESLATGLPFESVQSVTEDTAGRIWATTHNGMLVRREHGTWTNITAQPDWPGGIAGCVLADPSGAVWIGTRSRMLHRWAGGKFTTWQATNGLVPRNLHALLMTRNGDLWIAGNAPEALHRLRDGHLTNIPLPANIRVIRSAVEDTAGNVWLGTSRGFLLRVSGDTVVDETPRMGAMMSIRCLQAGDDGSLWIGYADFGVGWLKNNRFLRISTEQGLLDDFISQIVSDGHGWMWFGANEGIFKLRQDDLEKVLERRAPRVRPIVFGRGEGLPSMSANAGDSPGFIRARDGRLWMPMSMGIAVIDPVAAREESGPPPVILRRAVIDEVPVGSYGGAVPASDGIDLQDHAAELRLSPRHRHVEFEFTALSFNAPENVRFRYKLEGFDEKWTDSSPRRVANYTRLPAGNYTFRVQASHNSGVWGETPAPLHFEVEPFLWQTWWFRAGALALFTTAVGATVRYLSFRRLRSRVRALEQQAALEKERARIARDIHDDVGNRLTKITLLSGLALQDRGEPEKTAEHIGRISSTARQITDSLDEIVWAVNPRNDTLAHLIAYIAQYALEFLDTAGLNVQVDVPDRPPERMVPAEVRHNLFLVVKEALHNIVRHAGARTVTLRIVVDEAGIALTVRDDGRGFVRSSGAPGADGLRNMSQRVAEIGGEFDLVSTPGAGTVVQLRYPWITLPHN
jgi:signal transduction histidine kinase/ligand-binding sensor domain-containing protein